VARATLVAGRRRDRWLLVYRCPCGADHVAHAWHLHATLERTSACGRHLVLHVAGAERAA